MGVFKWMNRVLFGAESVAKSSADKIKKKGEEGLEKAEDLFEDLADKAEDYVEKGKDKLEKSGGKWKQKAEALEDKAEDFVEDLKEDIKPSVDEAKRIIGDTADKVKDKSKAFYGKAKNKYDAYIDPEEDDNAPDDASASAQEENVPREQHEEASDSDTPVEDMMDELAEEGKASGATTEKRDPDLVDRAKNIAEATGAKILGTDDKPDAAHDPLVDKASDFVSDKMKKAGALADKAADKIQEKMDETLEKAKELERKEKEEAEANPTGIREDSTHAEAAGKSTLSGSDDFFKKAERFADGDYSAAREGEMTIGKDEDNTDDKPKGKVKGFEDLDGDGDEIIDDAIMDDDDSKE